MRHTMEAFLKIIKTPQEVVATPSDKTTPSLIKQKRAKAKPTTLKKGTTSTPKGLAANESDLEFSKFTPMKQKRENIPTPWEDDSVEELAAPVDCSENDIIADDNIIEDGSETDNESSASSVYDMEDDSYDALSRDDDESNEYGGDYEEEEDIGVSYGTNYTPHKKTTKKEPKPYVRKVCRVPITYDDSTDYFDF